MSHRNDQPDEQTIRESAQEREQDLGQQDGTDEHPAEPSGATPEEPPADVSPHSTLRPEDQARVDGFLKRGVNSVERKPFRPLLLLFVLIAIVAGLSLFSQLLARMAGVY